MDQMMPWQSFEDLVRRILQEKSFEVTVHFPRGDRGFDLIGDLEGERWAIEVKFYRTVRAQPTLLEAAALRLVNNGINAQASKGMLVASCVLPADIRDALEKKSNVTFVDRVDLRNWAASKPELVEELDALLELDPSDATGTSQRPDPRDRGISLQRVYGSTPDFHGTELCEELKRVKKGKQGWAEYERVCAKILKYLFPNDLHGWLAQKRTDDGLNRFDFVCRVRPTTEFWKFVIDHLNSRYILFEFKNYAFKIKQGQILTTEKYLLERGLRKVAIILTRVGADQDAIKMTQGAMRELGKLMLVVSDDELCNMLHMKQRGEDPTDRLFELADQFLLSLPR